jgi:DNA polymerase/3'-5' exonuclease PolX
MNQLLIDEFIKLREQIKYELITSIKKSNKSKSNKSNKSNKSKSDLDNVKNSFRLKSIIKVIDILKNITYKIKSEQDVANIAGIGSHTLQRINEILTTGKLSEIKNNNINNALELTNIYGIGDQLAFDIYKKYNITTISELIKLYDSKKITLSKTVQKGLKYYNIVEENIPHSEIEHIDTYIHSIISQIDPELFYVICGSYRRMTATSNDIDIVVTHPNILTGKQPKNKNTNLNKNNYLSLVIKTLKKHKFIIDSLTSESVQTKYMGYCKYKNKPIRRIDIRFVPYDSYYTAILYFTGTKDFNRRMRSVALAHGYTLNEYQLTDNNNKLIQVDSEKDIFDALNMEYVSPEFRK